jgi:hypothetical protein
VVLTPTPLPTGLLCAANRFDSRHSNDCHQQCRRKHDACICAWLAQDSRCRSLLVLHRTFRDAEQPLGPATAARCVRPSINRARLPCGRIQQSRGLPAQSGVPPAA